MILVFCVIATVSALYENAHKKSKDTDPAVRLAPLKQRLLDMFLDKELERANVWCNATHFTSKRFEVCETVRFAIAGCEAALDIECLLRVTAASHVSAESFWGKCKKLLAKFTSADSVCAYETTADETSQTCAVLAKEPCAATDTVTVKLPGFAAAWKASSWLASFWTDSEDDTRNP